MISSMRRVAVSFLLLGAACTSTTEVPTAEPSPETATVPDLKGGTRARLVAQVSTRGLEIRVERRYSRRLPGAVLRQRPAAGTEVPLGSTVRVLVARRLPRIPAVAFRSLRGAKALVKARGFKVVVRERPSSLPLGTVLDYFPTGEARPGRDITLIVAAGPVGPCSDYYSGCVPIASDVDCAGGTGDGPAYVAGPVQIHGSDPYGLDGDGDGVGCE